jgi:hypothetical protein
VRRSTRTTAGKWQTARYVDSFLATVVNTCQYDGHTCALAYEAELQTEIDTGLIDITDQRVYAAKKWSNDLDAPSLFQSMNGEFPSNTWKQ